MMLRLSVLLVLVSGCSPTLSPQPAPGRTTVAANSTWFWRVTSSMVAWGACSDAADFRASVNALPFGQNSYVIYRTDMESKKARAQTCTALDPMTCSDSSSGVVFDVAGTELAFTRPPFKEPLRVRDQAGRERDSLCQITQLETWTLRDFGQTFELDVTNALGLEESTPPSGECDEIENQLIARSGNMGGIRGCVVTFRLGGVLR